MLTLRCDIYRKLLTFKSCLWISSPSIKPFAIIVWLQGSNVHRIKLQNNRKGFAIQNGIKIIIIIMAICALIATVLCVHEMCSCGALWRQRHQSPAFDYAKTLISLLFALPVVNFVEKFLLAIEIQLKTIKNVKNTSNWR